MPRNIIKENEHFYRPISLITHPQKVFNLTLVLRKIDKPYLNLVIDDLDSLSGVETRLESFVDIIEQV